MNLFRNIIAGVIVLMTASFACAQTLYKIESVNSGKVLDVTGASRENGAPVQQWDYTGALWQQWTIQDVGNGLNKIVNAWSGKVLDVRWASLDDGSPIIQQDYNGGDNQQWSVQDTGDGNFIFVRSGTGSVLDVQWISSDNGASIIQQGYNGGANQLWRLISVGECQPVTGDSISTSENPVIGASYEVYANNVQNATRVVFPTWTEANGQDELIWYEGEYDAANNRWKRTVQLSEHNNESGSYTTHVYAMGADGEWHCLFGTTVSVTYQPSLIVPLYRWERYIETQPGSKLSKKWGKDYLYTIPNSPPEGYEYAGVACWVFSSQTPGSIPLYSSFSAATGMHFYTTNFDEIEASGIYTYEGVACYVLSEARDGAVPFYRNYHGGGHAMGGHLYTVDPSVEALGAQSMDVSYWIWNVSSAEKSSFAALRQEEEDAEKRSESASTSPSGDITRYFSMSGIWDSVVAKWDEELDASHGFGIDISYTEITVKLWTPPFFDEGIQCYVFRP